MVWTANPLNLLVVDSTHRQPDFIGWYGYNADLLNTTSGLRLGKALKVGKSQVTNLIRNGNGNDTITLSAGQVLSSHPKVSNLFPTRIPATPGQDYTLGVTATGISGNRFPSKTQFKILWINSAGEVISETTQGITSAFGLGVRNWVTGIAPAGTVGMVVVFSVDHPATLSFPTLAAGTVDIRKGDPVFTGDHIGSPNNLFYTDPEASSIPWLDGWSNEFGAKINPSVTTLSVAANTEARLYFREDADTPTTMGIQVQPNSEYFFAITESPSRTTATVVLKAYDLTGTQVLGTYTPIVSGNRLRISFQTPLNAAWLAVKIVAGASSTSFIDPVLVSGLVDPGSVPPVTYGNFQAYFQFPSDVLKTVATRTSVLSNNNSVVVKNTVLVSDNLAKASLSSVAFVSDTLGKVNRSTQFLSDNTVRLGRTYTFPTDSLGKVATSKVFVTDSLQKAVLNSVVFPTDSAAKISKQYVVLSDTLQIVGQRAYQGGLESSPTLLTDEQLMTQYATRNPSRSWLFSADLTIGVARSFQLLSDNTDLIENRFAFLSDTTNRVVRGVIFTSDTLGTITPRYTLRTDSIGPMSAQRQFVLVSDTTDSLSNNFVLLSDSNQKVQTSNVLPSDTTKTVSIRFEVRSSINGRRRFRVISSRPLQIIGA